MDHELTKRVGEWLAAPSGSRDIVAGAELLLRLSRNRVRHANILSNPRKYEQVVEYELQKFYNFRVQNLTHEEFVRKAKAAEAAVKKQLSHTFESAGQQKYVGKRQDHDTLPAEIQKCYEDIPELRNRMREVHTRLRTVTDLSKSCLDSDAWPFVDELISLDKQIRALWEQYDSYIIS